MYIDISLYPFPISVQRSFSVFLMYPSPNSLSITIHFFQLHHLTPSPLNAPKG